MGCKRRLRLARHYHTGHRVRLRRRFHVLDSSRLSETDLLEMLLAGYYVRRDTRPISGALLRENTLEQLLNLYRTRRPADMNAFELYFGICSELIHRSAQSGETDAGSVCAEFSLSPQVWYRRLMPYLIASEPRVIFLRFEEPGDPVQILVKRFGEANLPVVLERKETAHSGFVLLACAPDRIPEAQLLPGIRYYLQKAAACPRSWKLGGLLLLRRRSARLIRISDGMLPELKFDEEEGL